MNAVSGTITYPANLLQVVSLDKSGSIINFWISDPNYSNSQGQVTFEGGAYNPGYTGPSGKIITVLFKAIAPGTANLSFVTAAVLANDGRGTNILDKTGTASLQISKEATPAATINVPSVTMPAITVTSRTDPDQNAWYTSGAISLAWQLPIGTVAVRTKIDQSPDSSPSVVASPPITSIDYNQGDGVWYFHVQGKDSSGWGPITNYKIQIDTSKVESPKLDPLPASIVEGEVLQVSGTTYPNRTVSIFLKDSSGAVSPQTAMSDSDGKFMVFWSKRLVSDTYVVYSVVSNEHGIKSQPSSNMSVKVVPPVLERVGWPVLNIATLIIIIFTIIVFCIAWIWYVFHRFSRFRKRIRADVKRADQRIHAKFKKLEDMVITQIRLLEREQAHRKLTAQEEKIIKDLGRCLEDVEEDIEKEVEEIGR